MKRACITFNTTLDKFRLIGTRSILPLKNYFFRMNQFSFLLLFICLTVISCKKKDEKMKLSKNNILQVEGIILKADFFSKSFVYTGSFMANESVELHPEISGKIIRLYFSEGSEVEKGQLLVKIDDDELQAELEKNKLQLIIASDEERRKKELLESQGISKVEYDIVYNKVEVLKAENKQIQSKIRKTEIMAPFHGTIGLRNVSEGAFVSSQTIIATIQQLNPLKIDFLIPEVNKDLIKIGKEIVLENKQSTNQQKAKIYSFEPSVDIASRSIRVRALTQNPNYIFMPGEFVNVNIDFTKSEKSILVPASSIVPIVDGSKVFIVKEGKVKSVKVIISYRTKNEVEITEGLTENDTLLTSGLLMVKENMPIQVMIKKK